MVGLPAAGSGGSLGRGACAGPADAVRPAGPLPAPGGLRWPAAAAAGPAAEPVRHAAAGHAAAGHAAVRHAGAAAAASHAAIQHAAAWHAAWHAARHAAGYAATDAAEPAPGDARHAAALAGARHAAGHGQPLRWRPLWRRLRGRRLGRGAAGRRLWEARGPGAAGVQRRLRGVRGGLWGALAEGRLPFAQPGPRRQRREGLQEGGRWQGRQGRQGRPRRVRQRPR
mmetsp:Transcript_86193/g.244527  ORF Transcript_86193/g.244527 Transcript_86193/m.244527 type:complete len:226 (-) Transcript_86193:714-1391(-)